MATALQEDLQDRAAFCRLLAQLYRREVSPELAASLAEAGLWARLADLGVDVTPVTGDREALRALKLEYDRIFIGPGPHVSPYGSVYHPDDPRKGQLYGETTKQVRRLALDLGLKFEGTVYDGLPDHVGHELELYARLLAAELSARSEGASERAERMVNARSYLLTRHLLCWVPTLCDKVQAAAKLPFYRDLARLTVAFLESEREALETPESAEAGA